ncbi:hypothetical protein GCM10011374_27030 [Kocuria dechangensis]|uniref:CobW C-terminal domain-containing protein n=1 Tax=Kocuria dechangensis TaxID=1176249 RepID=A0A917H014_9MICC|nr:GTP-binding protein [Kocuria dechangensis]GGG62442.1 hypothetical protein GCM10011374_27030 [Kocuria dechangensis]
MRLTVVSSLDALCRQQACESLADAFPAAVVMVHDLLDGGVVVRRIFRHGALAQRRESMLEHPCPSCAVRLTIVPSLGSLLAAGEEHVILGLPPTVPASMVIHALGRHLDQPPTVDSAVLACAPGSVEEQIWEGQSLFEGGCTVLEQDERTPGEFLVGELDFNDTVLLADPDLVPVDAAERTRGVQLLRELARHADVLEHGSDLVLGRHRLMEALRRAATGCLELPSAPPASPFTTVVHRVERPLHPGRFHQALATLAAGCCWLRGHLCLAAAPEYRILLQGIGPRVWLENTGPWPVDQHADLLAEHIGPARDEAGPAVPAGPGEHATVLAATGEDLDAAEIARLLTDCQLTEAEMRSGITGLTDPFGLSVTH